MAKSDAAWGKIFKVNLRQGEKSGTWSGDIEGPEDPLKVKFRPLPSQRSFWKGLAFLRHPAAQTWVVAVIVGALYFLAIVHEPRVAPYSNPEWDMWKLVASISVGVSLLLFFQGVAYTRIFFAPNAHASAKCEPPDSAVAEQDTPVPLQKDSVEKGVQAAYWIGAALFVAAVVLLVTFGVTARNREWPEKSWLYFRTGFVLTLNACAAVPWVVVVWLAHVRLQHEADRAGADPGELGRLQELWRVITASVLAFASFVVLAIVPTAVLRSTWFSKFSAADAEKNAALFPSSDVVLYGAFFGAVSAMVAFPLINAWRQEATFMLDRRFGVVKVDDFDEDEDGARTALEGRLGLNTGLLRSPLAVFTIFVPLVTTALAIFIPELAAG